jgi:hypothetical protein
MNATGTPDRKTVFHGKSSLWADRLNRLPRLEQPLTPGPRERRRGIVIRTDERAEMHEHVVTPHIVWETNVEAAPLVRDEAVASPDLALDVGQNLSPLVVKAQRTRRAGTSFTVEVPQQIVDGRRPWAMYAPNCLTGLERLSSESRRRGEFLAQPSVRLTRASTRSIAAGESSSPQSVRRERRSGWRLG